MTNNITAKSAVECLKKHKEERRHDFIVLTGAVDKAIEALEKQIPKKPQANGKYNFNCPNCNGDLGIEREDIFVYGMTPPAMCERCGQALDWSDE